jgi:hypothetical protein
MRNVTIALLLMPALSSSPASAQSPPTATEIPAVPTACDANCIRANSDVAAQACARPIEAQAPIDFEWVNRPYSSFFQEADPADGQSSIVIYRGDSIRFLTPGKAWVRMTFECAYDIGARKLAGVRVREGRIGQPPVTAPVAAAATTNSIPSARPPKAAQAAPPKQINGAALAAAIQRATRQPRAAPKPSRTMIIAEPSSIEVEQMAIVPN